MKNTLEKKGIILLLVVIVFAVMSVLSIVIYGIGLTDLDETRDAEERTKAYYYALSGIEIGRATMENLKSRNFNGIFYGNLSESSLTAGFTYEDSSTLGNDFDFDTLKDFLETRNHTDEWLTTAGIVRNDNGEIKIAAFGNSGDFTRNLVLQLIPINGIFDMAIFGLNTITISGTTKDNAKVIGKIGTNSTDDAAIKFDGVNATLDGTAFILASDENSVDIVVGQTVPIQDLVEPRDYQVPTFPEFDTFPSLSVSATAEIAADGGYEDITVVNGGELTFDLNNMEDMVVRAKTFNIATGGKLILKGLGTVWLYVDTTLSLNEIIGGESRLIIVYKGYDTVKISGQIVCDSLGIYAPLASVELAGQSAIKGAIIASDAIVTGVSEITSFQFDEELTGVYFPTPGGGFSDAKYIEIWSE